MKDFITDCVLKVVEVVWYALFSVLMIGFVIPLAIILMIFGAICEVVNFAGKKLYAIVSGITQS